MNLSTVDLSIIAGYFLLIITLGLYFGRKEENLTDYFLGGRRIAWVAILLSIVATETSALTFIGTPAFAYNHNWTYMQLIIGTIVARFIIAKLFITQFYRYKVYTVYEYLSHRFGAGSKNCASIIFLITRVLASGVRLFGASIIVSVATGLSPLSSIIIIAITAVIYTVIGGIKAVIWTDVVQVVVLLGGALLVLVLIPFDIADGKAAEQAVNQILERHGRVDLLVNNAGVRKDMLMVWMEHRDWQEIIDINLSGFYALPFVELFSQGELAVKDSHFIRKP